MDPAHRDIALKLGDMLRNKGGVSDHTNVGVGRTDRDGERVPALHVYITPKDKSKLIQQAEDGLPQEYRGLPIVWHVSGPARPLAAG